MASISCLALIKKLPKQLILDGRWGLVLLATLDKYLRRLSI
jgi:hypothetical protein